MIRNVIIAILISLALVSCSKDDEILTDKQENLPENAIGFTDGSLRSTGDLTNSNLSSMTVYAHYTGTADFFTTSAPNFMFNQPVAKSDGAWTYSPVRYWPMPTEKVSFFAITTAPGTGGVAAVSSSYTGYPSFAVTPPATPAQQQDICVASAMNLTKESNGGDVPLTFAHAMAKVSFSARYTGTILPGGGYVKIKQLHLTRIAGSGTLSLTASGFNWAVGGSLTNYFLSMDNGDLGNTPLSETAAPVSTGSGTLLLVPQTTTANTRVQLVAAFYDGATEKEYEVTATLPATVWEAGKQVTYSLVIDLSKGYMELDVPGVIEEGVNRWSYAYSGEAKTFVAPADGYYLLEAWGAVGAHTTYQGDIPGIPGGYSAGTIYLKQGQSLYAYVGEKGINDNTSTVGSWNGGGAPDIVSTDNAPGSPKNGPRGGGGATDFRLAGGDWNLPEGLNSRILVAGGSGAWGHYNSSPRTLGGYGGGLGDESSRGSMNGAGTNNASIPAKRSYGGTQTAGGLGATGNVLYNGSFGIGGSDNSKGGSGGGGGGWYGGGGGAVLGNSALGGGGGGSSFISGMTGCVAINPASATEPRAQDTNGITAALNYSATLFGASNTWPDGAEILFTSISMIDGEGYEWNTGTKAAVPVGIPASDADTANADNGYARITRLE